MHAGSHYNIGVFLNWTRQNLIWLFILAIIPTVLYEIFHLNWLAIPWQPVALVGTAAAFIAGFKNTQTYNRLWEARQIWGAIINDSRTWGIMVKDFVVNKNGTNEELLPIPKRIIYRHFAWLTALRFQLRNPEAWENQNKPYFKRFRKLYRVPEWETTLDEVMKPFLSNEDLEYVLKKKNIATQLLGL